MLFEGEQKRTEYLSVWQIAQQSIQRGDLYRFDNNVKMRNDSTNKLRHFLVAHFVNYIFIGLQ